MLSLVLLFLIWGGSIAVAVRSFPRSPEVRRRLNPLWLMIVPWGLAVLSGPLAIDHFAVGDDIRAWMTTGQYAALALIVVIAAVGILRARGARQCALAISFANLLPVFLLVTVDVMIIAPGS